MSIEVGEQFVALGPKAAIMEMVVTRSATGERFKRTVTTLFNPDGTPGETTEVDEPMDPVDPLEPTGA